MGKFAWEGGERILLQELVEYTRNGKNVPNAVLYLTDRRIVLLAANRSGFDILAGAMLGWLARKLGPTGERVLMHQIPHGELESMDVDGQSITFHDRGEGYAHTSFAIHTMTPIDVWKLRIEQWRAGTLDAATFPTATVVRR
jgi:hypothetical protein